MSDRGPLRDLFELFLKLFHNFADIPSIRTFEHDWCIIWQGHWLAHLIPLNLVPIEIIVHTPIGQHAILSGAYQLAILINWRACSRRIVFSLKFILKISSVPL